MTPPPAERPNILFILTDDQGPWAMGCAGSPEIRTPNLDRLAETGLRFPNFFCASPVCSPARASILTGRIPSQHGVHDWIRAGNMPEDGVQAEEEEPVAYLRDQLAYTEVLAEHGYLCGLSGKWHLGDSLRPQKGFGHWFAHQGGAGPYYDAPMVRDGEALTAEGYVSDVITDDALAYLDARAGGGEPFYLSVHYTAPHSPWVDCHPPEIVESYAGCDFPSFPALPRHRWQANRLPPKDAEDRQRILAGYCAAITAMDLNVGRLLDKLEERGLRESTLVVFTSDNGMNMGHHGVYGKGNGTFPMNMYDTSVKVPLLVSQPGTVPAGRVEEGMFSHLDIFPTLLAHAGVPHPAAAELPGQSFAPLLRGEEARGRDRVVVYDEYGPVRMIRSREWKYIHRYPWGPHELYDLVGDPGETTNLIESDAPAHRRAVAELRGELESWFHRWTDPARDGTHMDVTGRGQLGPCEPDAAGGRQVFHQGFDWFDPHGEKRPTDYRPQGPFQQEPAEG
jgi:arylsulfatase A-like enzyme